MHLRSIKEVRLVTACYFSCAICENKTDINSLSLLAFVTTGCGLKMRKLELDKKILAYYPMPNQELKADLEDSWLNYCKSAFLLGYYKAVEVLILPQSIIEALHKVLT